MAAKIGAINLITLDLIYANLSRIPGMGEEVSTDSLTVSLGGGPVAALVTARRLGASVCLATCLGEDHMSDIARGFLEEEGLDYRSFYPSDFTASPVNITSVMTFRNLDRAFVSYFPKTDFYRVSTDSMYSYLKNCVFCIASDPNPELFQKLRQNGCKTIYDVGWHDNLNIEDLRDVLKLVYLFAPNDKEAMKLTGAPTPQAALLRLADYVEQPIVKMGKEGALLLHQGQIVHAPPTAFLSVDSTGAGDAFLGGVTYGLLQGWDILRCVELGNYAGGKATTAIGCLTAKCSMKEFERMGRLQ